MESTLLSRSSGILLHPTSLPGPFGVGDLGPEAYKWIDTLAEAKQSWWQILPLGPTGFGDSPYQAYSAFAGNVNLLSPQELMYCGLLSESDLTRVSSDPNVADYETVQPLKAKMVQKAYERYQSGGGSSEVRWEYDRFREHQQPWVLEYARFMALRDAFGQKAMVDWPRDILFKDPVAITATTSQLANEIAVYQFGQFLFDYQWIKIKRYAHEKKIRIIGDAPIFVSGDSEDVWSNPEQFLLDANRLPTAVAGVPPDYFSETGQHWGNPLYDWAKMKSTGYAWWIARLKRQFEQVDFIRLDHFRGFAAAWHIPAGEKTAKNGRWVDGPRSELFTELEKSLGQLPIIAEDLGLITEDVHAIREKFALPGMRVLQFMLGGPENPYWPHNYEPNTVAYTGTHDNDTTAGWYSKLSTKDQRTLAEYTGHEFREPNWDLLRLAWSSVAVLAVAPWQDVLGVGGEARMNTPGLATGNWRWRFRWDQVTPAMIARLAEWTERYRRLPEKRVA